MDLIRRFLKELEDEITSKKFIEHYERITRKYAYIRPYSLPSDLVSTLHNEKNPDYNLNDRIISSLILEYRINPEFISPYLVILFRPGLLKIFSGFRQRTKELASIGEADLWSQIVTTFFEELNRIDLVKDNAKIPSKVIGRIKNKLRDYFKSLFREEILSKEPIDIPIRINPEEIKDLLERLVKSGIISKIDKNILLSTKIHKKSMKHISGKLKNLSYAAVRHRKARAQRVLYSYLKKTKKI
ncbi:hypothetical protein ACFL2G_04760 [Candidatus Omnitrophota bacterium]